MYRNISFSELRLTKDTGYFYFIDKEHPLATGNSGRVYYHRHVASLVEGRWILSEEHVHHLDGNKCNNTSSNLVLCSNSAHAKLHKHTTSYTKICKGCNIEFVTSIETQEYCSNICRDTGNIKNRDITKELLEELMPHHSWTSLGKLLNYSDNGIKKRAIALKTDISLIRSAKKLK